MGDYRSLYLKEISIKKELTQVEPNLAHLLRRHGWTVLGQGAEATVAYHAEKRYVLKLFPTNSRYKHFVSLCLRNRGNPHLPVFGRESRPIPGTDWSYVRMELLQKVSQQTLLQEYLKELCYLKYAADQHDVMWLNNIERRLVAQIAQSIKNNPSWLRQLGMRMNLAKAPSADPMKIDSVVKSIGSKSSNSWKQACDIMFDFMDEVDYQVIDLHEANFMLRGQQLVILDPWV